MRRQGWVRVRRGKDRRERLFGLTQAGKRKVAEAQPYWGRAEQRLRRELSDAGGKHEADDLANYRGRDGGVNSCNEYRCIYIYVIRRD